MAINNVTAVRTDINEILSKIRDVSSKSKIFADNNTSPVTPAKSFEGVFAVAKNALNNVNQVQAQAEQIKTAYVSGDSHIPMSQVIVASEKSKLALEGLIVVRNKILEAYKEIMNMPV